jgi:hypothetical protein
MNELPRDVIVHVDADNRPQRLTVGGYEFPANHVIEGIAVNATPGARIPLYRLWLCLAVEGTITDPTGSLRIVHEGDIDPFSQARPGPCGHLPYSLSVPGMGPPPMCTLDAGHAGAHKDERCDTIWREARTGTDDPERVEEAAGPDAARWRPGGQR